MTGEPLDLDAIEATAKRASDPDHFCARCGMPLATQHDFDTLDEDEGEDLCWREYGGCGEIVVDWRERYASDVAALVGEVRRQRAALNRASTMLCHAKGCTRKVLPSMFMCRAHWYGLPAEMRSDIWSHYVPGQERRKDPTTAYLAAASRAVNWTEAHEAGAL